MTLLACLVLCASQQYIRYVFFLIFFPRPHHVVLKIILFSSFSYEKDVHLFKSKVVDSVKLCNSHLFDLPKIEDPYAIRLVNCLHF